MPDAYIYLTIPDPVLAARMARRGPLPSHLVSPPVRAAISAAYDAYFTAAGPDLTLCLDGSASMAQLADCAEQFILGLRNGALRHPPDWQALTSLPAGHPRRRVGPARQPMPRRSDHCPEESCHAAIPP